MKRENVVQYLITFIFKYIWIICVLLIALETVSTVFTAEMLMKQSSSNLLNTTAAALGTRVNDVHILLNSLAKDKRIGDADADLYERAVLAKPYQDNFALFMIALCDENINVISSDETQRPSEPTSLAYRDYMQALYKTGEAQITDVFLAGSDHKTKNFTIAVPIMKEG